MSMREKLAWATEHGVTPPDYVLVAAAEEAAEDELGSCCKHSENEVAACCSARDGDRCCSKGKRATCSEGNRKNETSADSIEWVIGIHAQKCQGLALHWVTTGAIAPPPMPVEPPTDENPPAWCVSASPVLWRDFSQAPDVPPPRLS